MIGTLLKTAGIHWPNQFSQLGSNVPTGDFSNHDVKPDLFLSTHDTVSVHDLQKLHALAQLPSLVLTHNILLIPNEIRNAASIINICCDQQDRALSTFLFWIKSGKFIFDYLKANPKEPSIYHDIFLQLVRCSQLPVHHAGGFDLSFKDLKYYKTLVPFLEQVRHEYQLGLPKNKQDWYLRNYSRSIQPIELYANTCAEFCEIFTKIDSYQAQKPQNLDFLNDQEQQAFRRCMDFFMHKHGYN